MSRSGWRGRGSPRRSSPRIRGRCTADWTSGPRRRRLAERRGIPHHGLDLVDPDRPFTVADFADHARGVLAEIDGRGGMAILAGGTGLYLRAVARGIQTDALPSDAAIRARLEAEYAAGRAGAPRGSVAIGRTAPGGGDRHRQPAAGRPGARDRRGLQASTSTCHPRAATTGPSRGSG